MTLIELPDVEQRSAEWYDQRRGMVTASAVGQLITPSTLKPAHNDVSRGLTALLVAERITGYTDPTFTTMDMMRGVDNEPIARDLYSEHYAPAVEAGFLIREEDGWTLGFSPDGLVGSDGLIEIKAPRAKGHIRTILSGQVPAQHMAQIQAGLLVSGRSWLDFISFSGGLPLYVKRVEPDERWFEAIIAAVENFERTAADMVARYRAAVVGLQMTERIDFELVI